MTDQAKFRPVGTLEFLKMYMDRMTSRRLVGLFTDYEEAKMDVLFELAQQSDVEIADMQFLISKFEVFTDMPEWWDDLGSR